MYFSVCYNCFDIMLPHFCEKSYLGSKFGRMLPLASLSASPSNLHLELLNSTSRDERAPDKKHSSFLYVYMRNHQMYFEQVEIQFLEPVMTDVHVPDDVGMSKIIIGETVHSHR